MAGRIILGTANPSLDANGAPVSGSTLTFYRNGTTTLQSVFSAIDLMTPLANPLTCDASGEFPQIWATDSLAYSVKWSRPGLADVTYNDIYPMSIANSNYFRFVDVVATSPLVVASGLANGSTIDGQLISTGMRILLTAQTAGAENGIYDAPVSGAASRSADSNSTSSIPNGTLIVVQRGSTLKDTIWLHTTAVGFVLGTTALTFTRFTPANTRQVLTSSAGSPYVTPPGVKQLRIRILGGGGGGGGSSAANDAGAGGAGGFSSFDNAGTNYKANGGSGGAAGQTTGSSTGGRGGRAGTGGTSPNTIRYCGNAGECGRSGFNSTNGEAGGNGGGSVLGGSSTQNAGAPDANTGAGGAGGPCGTTCYSGAGGGAGEYVEIIINNPAASYTYTIGAAGTAGTIGSGSAGVAGATGVIIVDEIY